MTGSNDLEEAVQAAANIASKNSTDNLAAKVADSHRDRQNWDLDSLPQSGTVRDTIPIIVGITGLAGSGKDTLADMLAIELGLRKYGFADPIKEMINNGLGISRDTNKDQIDSRFGVTYRRLLQTLGTDWGRELIHKDIWIILSADKLRDRRVVISDVRFNNEAIWIRDRGYMIHIERQGIEKILESAHSSEQGVLRGRIDIQIVNDEGLEELREEANAAAATIREYEQEKIAERKKVAEALWAVNREEQLKRETIQQHINDTQQISMEDRMALLEGKLDGLITNGRVVPADSSPCNCGSCTGQ